MEYLTNLKTNIMDKQLGHREVSEGSTQPKPDPSGATMKACVWDGPLNVKIAEVPKPTITHPKDVIVKTTACTICSGSDSHIFSGEMPGIEKGAILGHESCGIVAEKGDEVNNLEIGDRVVIAFDLACGQCSFCKRHEYAACDTTNDSKLMDVNYGSHHSAIFGYTKLLGDVPGCQAEYIRVPFAEINCCKLPDDIPDSEGLFMSDVLCTSLHACTLGEVKKGDTVAIWGMGPIGLYAGRWAQILGASKVIGIEVVPERIELARQKFGFTVIDRNEVSDVPKKIMELVSNGVDCAIEASGFRFSTSILHKVERAVGLETDSPDMITECLNAVRKYGHVSIIADYVGTSNQFPIGHVVMKHLTIRSGQCPCQNYFGYVIDNIRSGKIDPRWMVTNKIKFDDLPDAYNKLFYKEDGYVKVYCDMTE
ncbi:glutathione-dependent formaldehyde dehydrogenase Fmd2 [Schizosaccharomyces pombe]|uniref:Zinc-type alcohol dehydrogenase-like protein C1198.01 n=1 Tax=Schizosaccharomyces pombe (strain 972 / ATCC 24843) TaxID=284812 RepID=YHG1_SCHPO|nr:putative glutathione-dependent formaldehyde dehydrogenase [Schizosaccharomyces pombe]Q9P6I8.1 RecName: Full=Zinc-type alcohol dehydrogenase-like protein C1198.01 [Schizosaccharomyces pombe 972h-]CAB91176.1 glutathione-dependent formaldehyde dehydrogenase (predicted) [Schizosaccharomyces pombe]|eukprot:NP_595070.1 putative glutathione-dependent formaldehyde dehydrogenase [Schizosaccharomyces pombe]